MFWKRKPKVARSSCTGRIGCAVVGPGEKIQLGPNAVYPMDSRHCCMIVVDASNGAAVKLRHDDGFWILKPGTRHYLVEGLPPSEFIVEGPADSPDLTLIVNWEIIRKP